jgi:hypothetical protein
LPLLHSFQELRPVSKIIVFINLEYTKMGPRSSRFKSAAISTNLIIQFRLDEVGLDKVSSGQLRLGRLG